ncbi:cyanophycinase [Levilinea saccharolytica]|uniref:Cyanophycinase n=1 Tax=Levilinea saccharolytica TaxID=229921 RepID=A0A0P6XQF2_9CHLR|nr:cyanophycinase [Levilinea saccharolytica]KPL77477.1 hypothetical protein ADN01_16465 [Levilinea saccharolytica]GAP18853.1 cyanophycinase [Levilinea saccharolytica]
MTTLMAIGGGLDLNGPILEAFHAHSGGTLGKYVIIPTASTDPESASRVANRLMELGCQAQPVILPIHQRLDTAKADYLPMLQQATGIFFTGGNQMRLSAVLGGSPYHAELQTACRRGCVIAGTSAGAAALSAAMIASGRSGQLPRADSLHMAPGLGFIDTMIFDQHFSQRIRLGRLIYAINANPALLGVGIDENTCAVIHSGQLNVIGAGSVTIVDGTRMTATDVAERTSRQIVAFAGMSLSILTAGCSYDISQRTAEIKTPMSESA